ncbi:MAG: TIGR04283 family arsenosugar biosynthesis glycosyltransferase [Candidatus Hydrogenedentes bacterium]|nr:TIGR04283 family arsenosugar biosynthesis glycosyltransferase [Candidatus Hydrogenedentota bacterium]
MRNEHTIAVIIPVLNEEAAIGKVIGDIPAWVDDIIVVDNGSTDDTARVAAEHGARVIAEPQRGYGAACLRGISALNATDIVVFLDGDYSDHPEEMPLLVDPVIQGEVDFMVGSRARGVREPGSLTPQAAFGNWLATKLIRIFWGIRYSDLGPFRAIRYRTLLQLGMADRDYGWTVEMQIKAALHAVPADEVPVSYRKREGVSKVSGTVRGVVGAGYKILSTIFLSALFSKHTLKTGLLIYFTRFPESGTTKTRLIPALGPEGAAELQRQLTEHTLRQSIPPLDEVETQIRYTGAARSALREWLGPDHLYAPQGEGNLGDRMARAVEEGFNQAYGKVVLCGTDCPALNSRHTLEAFRALDTVDLVIGPAVDGGYYLIGLALNGGPDEVQRLFEGVEWSTSTVREQTLANAERIGLSVELLEELSDVDEPEDLVHWKNSQRDTGLSVIIPTWNEEEHIGKLLDVVAISPEVEVIVADGGSSDRTVEIAAGRARVVHAERGRASQMNAGAAVATGRYLLFLHADSLPPDDFSSCVRRTLAFENVALGAFELRIDGAGGAMRFIESAANLRSRWLSTPYGDQGLFLRRDTWEAVGGYPVLPMLEDYALVRAARKVGAVVTLSAITSTSPRRWEREGLLRLTAMNVVTFFAYPMGVSPERIARWYGRE